jgi:alkanesulfonate monooxygenase SsuD/methylene tetrahydromethanopterin reductase-like flavin-dependent oxidoreductase (luciferase family)
MTQQFQFGLDTFRDITLAPDGSPLAQAEVVRNVIEEGVHADALGVDTFGVGEHHRSDFAVSAPEVVLAAIAARSRRIRLGSAVTVLSSDDPIRVFQRFSTLNTASNGRAEVTLGRGSFIESFPLFGYDLSQYEELFEEKLDLFVALLRSDTVTWQGRTRPPLTKQRIFPPIESGQLKAWVGVGGSPESVVRAARHYLPLALAIIGGDPKRFRPYVGTIARLRSSAGRRRRSRCIRRDMSPRPTNKRVSNTGRPTMACTTASAPSAAGRRSGAPSSIAKSSAGRSISARRRRSPARSPRPPRRSVSCASTSNTAPARSRTISSCAASSFTAAK